MSADLFSAGTTEQRAEQTAVPATSPEGALEPVEAPAPERSPWETALDDLERSVDQAEELVSPGFLLADAGTQPDPAWTPQSGLGPIPADLADRASRLLDRQLELTRRVEDAVSTARAHLRAVGSMQTNDTTASVYVDAVG